LSDPLGVEPREDLFGLDCRKNVVTVARDVRDWAWHKVLTLKCKLSQLRQAAYFRDSVKALYWVAGQAKYLQIYEL
jgi:hypothetical protein